MPITLNGIAIYPDEAPKTKRKIGAMQETANGGRTWLQRTTAGGAAIHKSEWKLKWNHATEVIRAQVEALYNVATTMTYVDQHGTNYTVVCGDDPYEDGISIIYDNTTNYYSVSLTIFEV